LRLIILFKFKNYYSTFKQFDFRGSLQNNENCLADLNIMKIEIGINKMQQSQKHSAQLMQSCLREVFEDKKEVCV
ncbi:hypothetical protein Q4566_07340, partial [Tamlana sp. 2_MG-2023]|uniref:hypothetical protein n=1 Tax=unclassified Tamlana TaxID=2614803 RepID=UPI0026E477F6